MKTASRAPQPRSPPLVTMRRYTPGVYPFLFPSIISSLPPSPQRLQIQQTSSSSSTPSPAESIAGYLGHRRFSIPGKV
ncbi:Elongation factor 4 [Dissostichus eleginoides]|uniref:Elongation factor 4 n=1 Tax=Dissostichus eleginoides TaxID=100907 RepID=A0AAD9BAC8_DISEL|nr:Elongation factor 4 [Dissostichus eleginoides]